MNNTLTKFFKVIEEVLEPSSYVNNTKTVFDILKEKHPSCPQVFLPSPKLPTITDLHYKCTYCKTNRGIAGPGVYSDLCAKLRDAVAELA